MVSISGLAVALYYDEHYGRHALVIAENSCLRVGPKNDYPLAYTINYLDDLNIWDYIIMLNQSSTDGWYQVNAQGKHGWIAADKVTVLSTLG